ncbi:MAG: hypothetical protein ACRCS6_09825 [Turicibacter sp.]
MKNNKDKIGIGYLLAILLIFFAGLVCWRLPDSKEIGQESAGGQPDFITKLFNKEELIEIDIQIAEDEWLALIENAVL